MTDSKLFLSKSGVTYNIHRTKKHKAHHNGNITINNLGQYWNKVSLVIKKSSSGWFTDFQSFIKLMYLRFTARCNWTNKGKSNSPDQYLIETIRNYSKAISWISIPNRDGNSSYNSVAFSILKRNITLSILYPKRET